MKDKPLTCREIIFIQLKMLLEPNVGDHMNILGLIMEQFTVSSFSPKGKFTHCLRVFETKHLMLMLKQRKISILSEEDGGTLYLKPLIILKVFIAQKHPINVSFRDSSLEFQ